MWSFCVFILTTDYWVVVTCEWCCCLSVLLVVTVIWQIYRPMWILFVLFPANTNISKGLWMWLFQEERWKYTVTWWTLMYRTKRCCCRSVIVRLMWWEKRWRSMAWRSKTQTTFVLLRFFVIMVSLNSEWCWKFVKWTLCGRIHDWNWCRVDRVLHCSCLFS